MGERDQIKMGILKDIFKKTYGNEFYVGKIDDMIKVAPSDFSESPTKYFVIAKLNILPSGLYLMETPISWNLYKFLGKFKFREEPTLFFKKIITENIDDLNDNQLTRKKKYYCR